MNVNLGILLRIALNVVMLPIGWLSTATVQSLNSFVVNHGGYATNELFGTIYLIVMVVLIGNCVITVIEKFLEK